ncbi:hypothetical protein [Sinomicrobium weinanense]|uniref:Uncharacterized protein n=1 Tax=Sinomicrobium weinanense TaxID=2842200 RepID=A0A926Q303_9FLAO|nr:hypothetical protein [Sinomicrobium weinanense]MBC9795235.1 hypothetical protein [Sinomicrobium weinanense]MBU3122012.1 hypothetical protein [Sinomicrobium weinanense]
MKKHLLFNIALVCSCLPMSVGTLIFLIWWGAREFYAVDLYKLEHMGFGWALISLWIIFIGLVLLVVFLVKKRKKGIIKGVVVLVLLLLNYPVSKTLMVKRTKLEQYAYVRVENNTEQDKIAVNIYPYFSVEDKILLRREKGKVFRYTPEYTYTGDRMYTVNSAILIVETPDEEYRIALPAIERDDCVRFYLDQNFTLQKE